LVDQITCSVLVVEHHGAASIRPVASSSRDPAHKVSEHAPFVVTICFVFFWFHCLFSYESIHGVRFLFPKWKDDFHGFFRAEQRSVAETGRRVGADLQD
jgi:hypothetical protein